MFQTLYIDAEIEVCYLFKRSLNKKIWELKGDSHGSFFEGSGKLGCK